MGSSVLSKNWRKVVLCRQVLYIFNFLFISVIFPSHIFVMMVKRSSIYSSSSQPASVSWWHAHSRALVFHTLYRGQRDTRIYPWISYISLRFTLAFAPPRGSLFTSLCHSSPPSTSAVAAAASRAPVRSIPTCSHHHTPTHAPRSLYDLSPRYNSDRLAM